MRNIMKLAILVAVLAGGPTFLTLVRHIFPSNGCGTGFGAAGASGTAPQIVRAPSISAPTILWALAARGSPAALQTEALAETILAESQSSGIDDALALAVWASETQDGRTAIPGTNNLGNITTPDPTAGVQVSATLWIRRFPTWQAGIAAWFDEMVQLYVQGGHATDLTTFALYYVAGLTPGEASAAQIQAIRSGYVHTVQAVLTDLQTHETTLHSAGTPQSGALATSSLHTLADLVPVTLGRGWSTSDALRAAAQVQISAGCLAADGGGNTPPAQTSPLVLSAMRLAAHLAPDGAGFFARWDTTAPARAVSQQGIVWCTDFVASVVAAATGHALTGYPDAQSWLNSAHWSHPGLLAIAPERGHWPQAGDVAVLNTDWKGHVAVIVGVISPTPGHAGVVLVAQAHSTHVLERWSLLADGTVQPPWGEWTATLGYLRLPLAANGRAAQVQPLLQWDPQAGYDSPGQHDRYWDADCSAAVFTELARAYGLPVRLGQVIDQLVEAGYLSASAGLLNNTAAWPWLAARYQLHAVVQWKRALSYSALLQLAAGQGVPVVVGVLDTSGRYYPAFDGGHFLLVVGGNQSGVRVVDSSLYRISWLDHYVFDTLWTGETVLVTP